MMAVKQTAGRDALGEFAPKFAELNDDVLFGEVWSREDKLSLRDRSLVTVVALMAQGLVDESFRYHLTTAKKNGITKEEIAEVVTTPPSTAAGPKPGPSSAWQKRFGTTDKNVLTQKPPLSPALGRAAAFFYAGDLIVVLFKIVHGTYQPGIVLQGGRF